jgi:hypothetical protein
MRARGSLPSPSPIQRPTPAETDLARAWIEVHPLINPTSPRALRDAQAFAEGMAKVAEALDRH